MKYYEWNRGDNFIFFKNCHFHPSEIECKCGCQKQKISQDIITIAHYYRDRIGVPVRCNSGHRCVKHNSSIPNASKNSLHTHGLAMDISSVYTREGSEDKRKEEVIKMALNLASFGAIGLGLYHNRVHFDLRDEFTVYKIF